MAPIFPTDLGSSEFLIFVRICLEKDEFAQIGEHENVVADADEGAKGTPFWRDDQIILRPLFHACAGVETKRKVAS